MSTEADCLEVYADAQDDRLEAEDEAQRRRNRRLAWRVIRFLSMQQWLDFEVESAERELRQ